VSLLDDPAVLRLLKKTGGEALLAEIGSDLVRRLDSLVASVSADSPLLDRLGSYGRADVLLAAALAPGLPAAGRVLRAGRVRRQVVALAARYTPVRDRFDVLTEERRQALLAIRRSLARSIVTLPAVMRLDAGDPPGSLTVSEILLGGRRREDRRAGWRRLEEALIEVITRQGYRTPLMNVGLDAPLAPAAGTATRARLGLVRTVLKRPRLVLLEGASPQGDLDTLLLLRRLLPEAIVLTSSDDPAMLAQADVVATLEEAVQSITLGRPEAEPIA
jgi:hypothetical protein